jgi:hypothetical protein
VTGSAASDGPLRLWRARKRHDAIDAILHGGDADAEIEFRLNGRTLMRRRYASAAAAREAADVQLRELQRVGWNEHW